MSLFDIYRTHVVDGNTGRRGEVEEGHHCPILDFFFEGLTNYTSRPWIFIAIFSVTNKKAIVSESLKVRRKKNIGLFYIPFVCCVS